ncbi:hypothetical protein BH11BAC3_BH11BAC3_02450 [soil metagenome]
MEQKVSERKEAWKTIFILLTIVTILSSLFHYAIVHLYPSSMYIGALMWCPVLASNCVLWRKCHNGIDNFFCCNYIDDICYDLLHI